MTAETSALVRAPSRAMLAELEAVKAVLAPDANEAELRLFAMVASRSGLDPFAKQIYAIRRQGRLTFQTGIDGYRSIAARTGEYNGQDEPAYGPDCACGDDRPKSHPEFVTVKVYRKGIDRAIAATAYWHEYKPAMGNREHPQDGMWIRMPRVMLAKVAEALALRKAFPWDPTREIGIGNDLYTSEEMDQADAKAALPAQVTREDPRARLARRANPQGSAGPASGKPDPYAAVVAEQKREAGDDQVDEADFREVAGDVVNGSTGEILTVSIDGFADQLRNRAAAQKLSGPATPEQRDALRAIFKGIPAGIVGGVLAFVFDDETTQAILAAEAAAILAIAKEDAGFVATWRAVGEQLRAKAAEQPA